MLSLCWWCHCCTRLPLVCKTLTKFVDKALQNYEIWISNGISHKVTRCVTMYIGNIMVAPPSYNALYGIINYTLPSVTFVAVCISSVVGVVKWGSIHNIAVTSMDTRIKITCLWSLCTAFEIRLGRLSETTKIAVGQLVLPRRLSNQLFSIKHKYDYYNFTFFSQNFLISNADDCVSLFSCASYYCYLCLAFPHSH